MAASADPIEATRTVAAPAADSGAAAAAGAPDFCVDVLVARAGGLADRPLTYGVPPALRAFAAVGMRVQVPLGARRALGFVLAVRRVPSRPDAGAAVGAPNAPPARRDAASHMRAVLDFPDDAPLFSELLLALAREVADETLSSLRDAVASLVPPDVFHAPFAARPRIAVRDPARPLPPRVGRRQSAMLAALSASPAGIPVPELARAGGGPALRRLVACGAVRIEEMRRASGAPAMAFAAATAPGAAVDPPAGRNGDPAAAPVLLIGAPDVRAERITAAVGAAVRAGSRALVVVPEIADASALGARLAAAGGASVAVLHSGLPPRDRREAWTRARDGRADIVVGTRSALFAPLPRLGLIVIDDEPNAAYKSDAAPRYHARDVAFRRARLERTGLVLGSAAPSVEMYAAAAERCVTMTTLPARRPAAAVSVVDMRAEERRGHIGYLSRALVQAMSRHLRARGRIALLVSRRGYARVLLCRECGAAVRCPACTIPMAYDRDGAIVRCTLCGRAGPAPDLCPHCGGVGLRGVGAGTKRIEEVVHRLFPALRMARLDADTSRGAQQVLREFADGRLRVLIGSPMVLHAPARPARPTLVGVVDADGPLYRPDFRASERTLQRLRAAVQWAAPPGPEVIIQTRIPEHPVLRAIRRGDDAAFYEAELAARRDLGYPPYARLVRIVAEAATPAAAYTIADGVAAAARAHGIDVLGPAPVRPPRSPAAGEARGRRSARAQCVLRIPSKAAHRGGAAAHESVAAVRAVLAEVPPPAGARIVVDVDPQELV